jgi:hypothetical protein
MPEFYFTFRAERPFFHNFIFGILIAYSGFHIQYK